MANVKLYRGKRARYDYTVNDGVASGAHKDGLYYATDTRELLMNGVSYGNTADLKLEKRAGASGSYTWSTADTIYWGNTYRISAGATGDTITFTTASVAANGYLTLSSGTDLDIASGKIQDYGSAENHEKLTTKGYVDNAISTLETALNNAIVSVSGNGGESGAAGGTTVTLTKASSGNTYSGTVYFTEKDGGSQPIAIQFDATDFIADGILDTCVLISSAAEATAAGKTAQGTDFPYLLMTFVAGVTGQKQDIWVPLKSLVDTYTAGNGLNLNNEAFSVKPKTNGGITVDGDGVSVATGNGLQVGAAGVSVKAKTDGGITVDSNGVSVATGNGLQADSNGVSVKTAGYVTTDNSGNVALDTDQIEDSGSATGHDKLSTKGYVDAQVATKDANVLEGVQINGTDLTITSKKVNIVTNTAYDASTNKIATMADVNAGLQWIDVPDTQSQE